MFDFIRNALGELEHIVWPTKKESRTYMNYTISVMIIMSIILFGLGILFREGLHQSRLIINPNSTNNALIEQLQRSIQHQNNAAEENMKNFNISASDIQANTTSHDEADRQDKPIHDTEESQPEVETPENSPVPVENSATPADIENTTQGTENPES